MYGTENVWMLTVLILTHGNILYGQPKVCDISTLRLFLPIVFIHTACLFFNDGTIDPHGLCSRTARPTWSSPACLWKSPPQKVQTMCWWWFSCVLHWKIKTTTITWIVFSSGAKAHAKNWLVVARDGPVHWFHNTPDPLWDQLSLRTEWTTRPQMVGINAAGGVVGWNIGVTSGPPRNLAGWLNCGQVV